MHAYLLSSFSVALGIIRRLNSQNLFLYVSLYVSCPFAVLVWLLSLSLSPFLVFYRASLLVVDLGWVDFDLGVPSSCPAAQPLLPYSH